MKIDTNKLRDKGWTEEEIEKTQQIITRAEENKHPKLYLFEIISYWFLFIVIIISGITLAWVIQPILIFTNNIISYIIVAIFGLLFGSFAIMIIRTIEKLERHHHILISLIIPLTSLISGIFIISRVNKTAEAIDLFVHNPYIISGIFAFTSLIPYIIFLILEKKVKDNGAL